MTVVPSVPLAETIRRYHLLDPAQLQELPALQTRFLNPKALAGELIRRGWLTPYQANQLLQGKGEQLLLGSYVLLERIGEGGMGQVFKAKNWKLGRVVALKLIRKERLDNPDAIRRFQREVRAAAALSHPNIVHAHDADEIAGTHLLVMECVEGAIDLNHLVKQNGSLPVTQACDCIRQTALGLQHACERELVHRDIKPHNLLLTANRQTVKILDMGLARLEPSAGEDDNTSTMTQEGTIMGTPDYIAPEQALESHTVDIRADLYSLGCTFYYLLTGQTPFPTGTFIQKINKHQFEQPRPVEQLHPDVPAAVAEVVRKLMAKRPENRYQTPAEVATVLAAIADTGTIPRGMNEAKRMAGERQPAMRANTVSGDKADSPFADLRADTDEVSKSSPHIAGRRRWLLGAGGGLVLAGVLALLLLAFRPPAETAPKRVENSLIAANASPPKAPANVDDDWLLEVSLLPAEKQVEAVAAKLKQLNRGFDGKVTHKIENGAVTELEFVTDQVTDITPVRALRGLKRFQCHGSADGKGQLIDLSPLKGILLTDFGCAHTKVNDLSPLKGMPLTHLYCHFTPVSDLSPLKGMPLWELACFGTRVSDLSPLKGMELRNLTFDITPVSDLSPLEGMPLLETLSFYQTPVSDLSPLKRLPLRKLTCFGIRVTDLSPLKGMKLTRLSCPATVTDLSPLKGMSLKEIDIDFKPERDTEILRSLPMLETINAKPAQQFWKEVNEKKP